MTMVRRHLRLWVAAWIAFQVASLSAFVPRECCIAHRVPVLAQGAGETCHHPQPAPEDVPDCALRSTCNGPLAILAALLSPHAVLAERSGVTAAALSTVPPRAAFEHPHSLAVPPDSPPPRS
jgi:hypothetical protein